MAVAPVPALFEPAGEGFAAAALTRGPWDARMMHGGAPSALIAHAIEQVAPAGELAVSRLTVEFLGGVPVGDVSVHASLLKPGKRFQLVDATLHAGERLACLARAVRLRRADMPDAVASSDGGPAPPPPPDAGEPWSYFAEFGGERFYPDATEILVVGGAAGVGHAVAWIRLRGELLPGVAPSPLVRVVAAADFTNGLSWILPYDEWLFVNTELTVHLHREPEGEWIGLDARTVSGATGAGLSTGALYDQRGPIGVCAQSLFVQRR
jgi:acyl-coenzyme A thioesterase PaaI-like protein